jgi:hypothetical protein
MKGWLEKMKINLHEKLQGTKKKWSGGNAVFCGLFFLPKK